MAKYFMNLDGEYLFSVGVGIGDMEITREEYENILAIVRSRPKAESGYDYKLRTDLTWELVEAPTVSEEDLDISADEALSIILGGEA